MAALLVAIAILSIMLLVALPAWSHNAQREKEAELIFRGEQYGRAIALYQRKLAGALPPSIDALVEGKYLRKKYKDPITGEDFVPIYANSAAGMEAVRATTAVGPEGHSASTVTIGRGSVPQQPASSTPLGQASPGPGRGGNTPSGLSGGATGIIGVMSKSDKQAIKLYNGRDRYNQWLFTYALANARAGFGQTVGPGQQPAATQPTPLGPQRGAGPGRSGRGQ